MTMENDFLKFRIGKRSKSGKIVYLGNDCFIDQNGVVLKNESCESLNDGEDSQKPNQTQLKIVSNCADGYFIERCTGIKDIDGVLIYEGDVIKTTKQLGGTTYKVLYNHDECYFEASYTGEHSPYFLCSFRLSKFENDFRGFKIVEKIDKPR